jgi:hypothetical protein
MYVRLTDSPGSVLRSYFLLETLTEPTDILTADTLASHRSSLLISAERGDLENELVGITEKEAAQIRNLMASRAHESYPSGGMSASRPLS